MIQEVNRIGQRGTWVIPAALRQRFGLNEGTFVSAEEHTDGILLRPVAVTPVETYTPQRKAEFLLNNAVDKADYAKAIKAVKRLGLDPKRISHRAP